MWCRADRSNRGEGETDIGGDAGDDELLASDLLDGGDERGVLPGVDDDPINNWGVGQGGNQLGKEWAVRAVGIAGGENRREFEDFGRTCQP